MAAVCTARVCVCVCVCVFQGQRSHGLEVGHVLWVRKGLRATHHFFVVVFI